MQSCAGLLAINWVFQGMRGMQSKELSFRLMLEALLAAVAYAAVPADWNNSFGLLFVLFIAHTLNWLFNGHVWVCARYCAAYRRNPSALSDYIDRTSARLQSLSWLEEAAVIGSVGDAGRIRSERSDIDLRLIFSPGIVNWLRVNMLLLRLRTAALFQVIPLDLYAYNFVNALDRFRQDEGILLIQDKKGRIAKRYGQRVAKEASCESQSKVLDT